MRTVVAIPAKYIKITSYVFLSPDIEDEMREWLQENTPGYKITWMRRAELDLYTGEGQGEDMKVVLVFLTQHDAAMFKLRWFT